VASVVAGLTLTINITNKVIPHKLELFSLKVIEIFDVAEEDNVKGAYKITVKLMLLIAYISYENNIVHGIDLQLTRYTNI
jgi:hypothetical protein